MMLLLFRKHNVHIIVYCWTIIQLFFKVVAGKIYSEGRIVFSGNNAAPEEIISIGGALHMFSRSQLIVQNGTYIDFISNTGR